MAENPLFSVDLDEFLVAPKDDVPLLHSVVANGSIDCLVLRTSTTIQYDSSTAFPVCHPRPRFLNTLQRQDYVFPENERTKYLCRARKGMEAGIHTPHLYDHSSMVWRTADPENALLIHVRNITLNKKFAWINESRILPYAKMVNANIESAWKTIFC